MKHPWFDRYLNKSIRRVNGHFERVCPTCRRIGVVGIYPGREAESMRYITREGWECVTCERNSIVAQTALLRG